LLVALGAWGYLGTGTSSVTALIPAFVGAPLALLGALALKERFLKHAMHGAAMIGLLAVLGGLGNTVRVLLTKSLDEPKVRNGLISTALMTLICAVFVALCVNSFVQVRRRRRGEARAPAGT
jgi:hypothetical protein